MSFNKAEPGVFNEAFCLFGVGNIRDGNLKRRNTTIKGEKESRDNKKKQNIYIKAGKP